MTIAAKILHAIYAHPSDNSEQIAERTGAHPSYVRTVARRNGVSFEERHPRRKNVVYPPRTKPKRRYRKLQDWERCAIEMACLAGEKHAAVAAEFNVTPGCVSKIGVAAGARRWKS